MKQNIAQLMALLDWNNSQELQKRGIDAARAVSDLYVFIQPVSPDYHKNVWENCAKIRCKHSDTALEPYLTALLKWLQDLTWPGALRIMERLSTYQNSASFAEAINDCKIDAVSNNDEVWLENIGELQQLRQSRFPV